MLDFIAYNKYCTGMEAKKKKKKMGRPPLKPKDRRSAITTLRLTETDRKLLEKQAGSKGMSISSYLLYCWKKGGEPYGKRD